MIEKKIRAINLIESYGDQDSKYLKISRPKYLVVKNVGPMQVKRLEVQLGVWSPHIYTYCFRRSRGCHIFLKKNKENFINFQGFTSR